MSITPSELADSVKAVAPVATPVITKLLEHIAVPAISRIWREKTLKFNLSEEQVKRHLEDYLLRTFAKLSFINTLVFPNQQTRLTDIYVPLTVRSKATGKEYVIEKWVPDFIPTSQRVLITDTAGMGKSTLLKRLFLDSVDCHARIPLFVELKSVGAKGIVDKLLDDLSSYEHPFPKDLLWALLKRGDFIIFLDGYDEVPLEYKEFVTRDIQDFVNRCFENWFVISSRSDPALSCLGEFQAYQISPLKRKEAYALLRKYDKVGRHANALISELDAGKYEQVRDLLRNPMLVSLLFKAYTFKAKVPFRKHIFYRQVFDALFEAHDFTKGESFNRPKHSGLDIDDFHSVLREFGFSSSKLGRVDLSKDKIIALLSDVRDKRKDIKFQPADLLLDLVTTVPLFTCEGSEYNWAHKSVQDYFASQFIFMDAKKDQKQILLAIYKSENGGRFSNVIDILHDTDPATVRQTILRKLLQDFIIHYENSYNNIFPGVAGDAIQARKQRTFQGKTALTAFRLTAAELVGKRGKTRASVAFAKLKKLTAGIGMSSRMCLSTIYGISSGDKLALAATQENRAGTFVLPILAAKKYPFVSVESHRGMPLPAAALKEDQPIVIDDDPASPLNSAENFEGTTATISNDYVLDYQKSKAALQEIDREIAEFVERDPLTAGI